VLTQGSPGQSLFQTRSDEAESLADSVDSLPDEQRAAFIEAESGAYLFMKCRQQIRDGVRSGERVTVLSDGDHQVVCNLDWIRQHLAHPADEIVPHLRVPVAFFSGALDRNVHPENAEHLAAVAEAAGNPAVTLRIFPGLDHGMRPAPPDREAGLAAMTSLTPSVPTDPGYLDAVADWALTTLGAAQP